MPPRKPSPNKTALTAWTVTDSNRRDNLDLPIESSRLVLETLQSIGSMSGTPFLNEAAGIALRILTIVQEARSNNQEFTDLANAACGLVYTIIIECQNMIKDGQKVPDRVQVHIVGLARNLSEIEKFAQSMLKRGTVKKVIYHGKDLDEIKRYHRLLTQSLAVFHVQSEIAVAERLDRINHNIEETRVELKADRTKQEADQRRKDEDMASQLEVLRIMEEDRAEERMREERRARRAERAERKRSEQEAEERRRSRAEIDEKEWLEEIEERRRSKAERSRLAQEQEDIMQEVRKRTPSPQPYPFSPGQFYQPVPMQGSPYLHPGYPVSLYNLAPPPMSPGSISISNLSGSAVSLGGSPVSVSNWNSGNFSNVSISNSNNVYTGRKSPHRARRHHDSESDND